MNASNRRWLPVIAIICASSVCLTGCKSFSWSKLPGMSYFAKDDNPEQSYYGTQNTPSNDYAATTVDYSQRYDSNATGDPQNSYGQQYESTNIGGTNYLGSQQPAQQATQQTLAQQQPYGQQQQYGQQQPYGNQTATYPAQTQQYQPPQNLNPVIQGQNTTNYQPQAGYGGQPVANQNVPTAGTLKNTAGNNYSGGGFYNPNGANGAYAEGTASNVPTYGAEQNQGAAAYISEAPTRSQFDGGAFVPNGNAAPAPTATPMPAYRPGSTGDTNGYYAPNTGSFNGQ